jgi:hypothetical protein
MLERFNLLFLPETCRDIDIQLANIQFFHHLAASSLNHPASVQPVPNPLAYRCCKLLHLPAHGRLMHAQLAPNLGKRLPVQVIRRDGYRVFELTSLLPMTPFVVHIGKMKQ